jgi:hypothetical protein
MCAADSGGRTSSGRRIQFAPRPQAPCPWLYAGIDTRASNSFYAESCGQDVRKLTDCDASSRGCNPGRRSSPGCQLDAVRTPSIRNAGAIALPGWNGCQAPSCCARRSATTHSTTPLKPSPM